MRSQVRILTFDRTWKRVFPPEFDSFAYTTYNFSEQKTPVLLRRHFAQEKASNAHCG